MSRGELFPIINVDAIQPVRSFYEDVLDATLSYRFPDDGDPVYITLTIGRSTLALGVGTGPALYGETPLPAHGHAVDLCVYVPDLDAAVDRAPTAGGSIAVPAMDTPWGERVAYLRDPQGTMLLVIQDT
jgi:predicted enzyme related to lactoylglutathione lyase